MSDINQQQAFLFMPDISGFTQFVNQTEIEHSTHIIQELLETIIDANHLNLELMEIEGDAVFFYRHGEIPSINEIITQSKTIFAKFHRHLVNFESHRICQCGACKGAHKLTLKFIAHSGIVGSYYVRDHFKLIGKDIILLHRLLKNSIPENEYLLFTEPFFELLKSENTNLQQFSVLDRSEEFDNNMVFYKYVPIKQWCGDIKGF